MSFLFTIVTPAKRILTDRVEGVTLPGVEGQLTVLPRHTHIVTTLVPGEVRYSKSDEEGNIKVTRMGVGRGVAEMSREGKLTIFTKSSQPADIIK